MAQRFDIIVVGGGAAGMTLAVAATRRGARVLIVEKSPVLGGTLDRSWASTSAAGTSFQAEYGIKDDPQAHYDDVMRISDGHADPALTRLWVEEAARTIAWMQAIGVGFKFSPRIFLGAGAHEPYRIPRVQLIDGRGPALIAACQPLLDAAVKAGRLTILLQSQVFELVSTNGRIGGIRYRGTDGRIGEAMAGSVVLTAGGAAGMPRAYQELHGVPLYFAAGFPFCTGDGIFLGQGAGGTVRGAEHFRPLLGLLMSDQTIPGAPLKGDFLTSTINASAFDRPPWEIWVNAAGTRFVREDHPSPSAKEAALGKQPGHAFWMIHDAAMLATYGTPMSGWKTEDYVAAFVDGQQCVSADSIGALAVKAGIDPQGLQQTVARYNADRKAGRGDLLGREHRPASIEAGPFYAVRLQGYTLQTFAGLAADGELRVLSSSGRPIPGLYAAGEVLGGTAVGSSSYSTGCMITSALSFGRLLGERLPL